MRKISVLPSLLTLCNFSCGFVSIILCIQSIYWRQGGNAGRSDDYFHYACLIIFLGMVFDMMDGRVARMTNSQCQFGGELDSLADVCTFGVAPAVILGTLWVRVMPPHAQWWSLALIAGGVYAVCAALRLAMYNTTMSDKPKNYFSGVPSPAAAGAVVSSVLFFKQNLLVEGWQGMYDGLLAASMPATCDWKVMAVYLFSVYVIIVGLLMVSPFRFAHLTNLWFGKGKKFTFLIVAVIVAALLITYTATMLFLGFNAFIVICLFINIRNRLRNRENEIERDMNDVLSFGDEIEGAEAAEEVAAGAGGTGEIK